MQAQGRGLSTRKIGQKSGTETNSLTISQLPSHNHPTKIGNIVSLPLNVEIQTVSASESDDDIHSVRDKTPLSYSRENEPKVETINKEPIVEIGNTGNSLPINNMQPFAVVNYIIALDGINPERL